MTDCTTDPTIVACTGEDQGREYDLPAQPSDTSTVVEVGTVDPTPYIASTGVPVEPYAAVALLLVAVGACLRRWAR